VNYVKSNQSRRRCKAIYLVEHWLSSTAASGKVSSQHSNGHEHESISRKRAWSLGKELMPWYPARD
jgi:hypothetical protein